MDLWLIEFLHFQFLCMAVYERWQVRVFVSSLRIVVYPLLHHYVPLCSQLLYPMRSLFPLTSYNLLCSMRNIANPCIPV